MHKFNDCIQRIFTKRMQEELTCEFTVNNENKLVPRGEISGENFLKLFSVSEYYSPELIWNAKTRSELLDVLQRQIDSLIAEDMTTREMVGTQELVKSRRVLEDISSPSSELDH